MHHVLKEPTDDDPLHLKTLETKIFRASRSKNAFLFDISTIKDKYTDLQCMQALKNQHEQVYACVPLNDGPRRYLEVYIMEEEDTNSIAKNGIVFQDAKLRILPSRAIDENAKIINLKLSNLPMLPRQSVTAGLEQSLKIFGKVLDLGINTERNTGLFMGSGYAVLDVHQNESTPVEAKFLELSHQLSWCESSTELFYATWNNMPTWCRYCHKDGHTKFDCPLSKARIICYACHEMGHRSFECTRRNTPVNTKNKRVRKSYLTKTATPDISTDSDDDEKDPNYTPEDDEKDSNYTSEDDDDKMSTIDEEEQKALDHDTAFNEQKEIMLQYDEDTLNIVLKNLQRAEEIDMALEDQSNPLSPQHWQARSSNPRAAAFASIMNENNNIRFTYATQRIHRVPTDITLTDYIDTVLPSSGNTLTNSQ
jgi:hypothetical protein